ncbi:MAG: CHAT domain-containing protein [bacterium]|nr:CHAT domain-containing protein [bacterium]
MQEFPISGQIATAIDISLTQLLNNVDAPPSGGKVLLAERLGQNLYRPSLRQSAADSLLRLLDENPRDLCLLDKLFSLNQEMGEMPGSASILSNPALLDTGTALGLYARGRQTPDKSECLFLFLNTRIKNEMLHPEERLLVERQIAQELRQSDLTASSLELLLAQLASVRRHCGPALEGQYWRDIAGCLLKEDRLHEAMHALRHADRLFASVDLHMPALQCLQDLATLFAQLGVPDRASLLLRQIDQNSREMDLPAIGIESLQRLSGLYTALDEVQTSLAINQDILRRAWVLGKPLINSLVWVDIASNYLKLGYPDSAFVALDHARLELKNRQDPELLHALYLGEADFWLFSGNYQTADSLRQLAEDLGEQYSDPNGEIRRLFRMARYGRETGRPETARYALSVLNEMKSSIFMSDPGFDPRFEIDLEIARLKMEMGEFDLSRHHLNLAERRLQLTPAASKTAAFWNVRGLLNYHTGDTVSALAAIDSAQYYANASRQPALKSRQHQLRGRILLELGNIESALEEFEEVGRHLDQGLGHRTLQERQLMLGLCASRQGAHRQAVAILSRTLDITGENLARDLAIRFHLELSRSQAALHQPVAAYENILEACRLLVDGQLAGGDSSLRHIASDVLKDAYLTRIRLIINYPHLVMGRSPARESLILRQEMEDLSWGKLPALTPPTLDGYCAAYLLDEHEGYLWFTRDEEVWFFIIPGTDVILPEMEMLLRSVSQPNRPEAHRSAARLAEHLLGPVADIWPVAKRLRIMPDDNLHGLPWVLLPWQGETLLDHASITLTSSISAPPRRREVFPNSSESILAIGFNGLAADYSSMLKHAEEEAEAIVALWPGESSLLLGRKADGDLLRSACSSSWNTIHLAVHAQVHQGLSEQAYLHLATGTFSGSMLTVRDIAQLDLDTELVYLSCCEASRDIRGRSGALRDLSRAFIEAGARSVLASTRRIDDRSAREFALRFYKYRTEGKLIAEALRLTQKGYRDGKSDWSHPYYWAHYLVHTAGQ